MVLAGPVNLPATSWVDDRRIEWAVVRPLSGEDELAFGDHAARLARAAFVSELLGRCVLSLGGDTQPSGLGPAAMRSLTCGDREALLLHLRAATWGPTMALVITCETCGEPMDIEVATDDILQGPSDDAAPNYVLDGKPFRLPTGADEEVAAALDATDGAATLLRRCMFDAEVDDTFAGALAPRIERLDPQARTELAIRCPTCNASGAADLDMGEILRADLLARRAEVETHVHLLALHYHWTESDVLALPAPRRRRYVELLVNALTEGSP